MRHQHQASVVGKAPRIDVSDEVVREDSDAVVHVSTGLAIGEPAALTPGQ